MKTHARVLLGPRWNLPDNSHLGSFIVTRMTKPGPRATRTFLQHSGTVVPAAGPYMVHSSVFDFDISNNGTVLL